MNRRATLFYAKNVASIIEFLQRFFGNLLLGENNTLQNREMHVHYTDTVKTQIDTVNSENDTVNDPVFSLVRQNKDITATEISQRLSMSLSTVKRKIKDLKEQGILKRIGSDKTGYWEIVEK